MHPRSVLINRMTEWLEEQVEKHLAQEPASQCASEELLTRQIGVLTNLYILRQTSVRMQRQQKLFDDVKREMDEETGGGHAPD